MSVHSPAEDVHEAHSGQADAGTRLDRFLAKALPNISRSRLQALIRQGSVTCDGATVREANHRVMPGQTYHVGLAAGPLSPVSQHPGEQAASIDLGDANAWHLAGVALAGQGQHGRAADAIARAIALSPAHAQFHTDLGSVLYEQADYTQAIEAYRRAIELDPSLETVHGLLERACLRQLHVGLAQQAAGRPDEARRCYDSVLRAQPHSAEVWHLLGVLDHRFRDYAAALACYDRAVALRPDHATALRNRGLALKGLKRLKAALASYDRALALRPDYAEALNGRAVVLRDLNRPADALVSIDRALALKPDYAEALNNRGNALQDLKRFEDALVAYDRALALEPEHVQALNNRGVTLRALGRFEEALAAFERALALRLGYAEAMNNRGNTLQDLKRYDEALASYDRALVLQPGYAKALGNRALTLHDLKRFDEALANYDRAIASKPDYAEALNGRGMLHLLCGRYREGWADHEWRWKVKDFSSTRPKIDAPEWRGEDIEGRNIVVYAEQGLGDVLQFVRYLPLLVQRGANVSFFAPAKLLRLLRSVSPQVKLISALEAGRPIDFQCALMSLPAWFQTELGSIPDRVPYLAPEPDLVDRWKRRIGEVGFKIGIAWQGRPDTRIDWGRSFPLSEMLPLARVPGVRLLSLQKNHGLDQLTRLPAGTTVEILGDDFDCGADAFVDTAAVMSNLDLIITSDTSIAHLAGALGCRTWVALKYVPDWRWLLDRNDSPWYPATRVFRQEIDGDWKSVFSTMERELRVLMRRVEAMPMSNKPKGFPPNPEVQVSWGELMDKITILEIKEQRLGSPEAVANVRRELALLQSAAKQIEVTPEIGSLKDELRAVNDALWQIEDDIRAKEAAQAFDQRFVELARSVYFQNDKRGTLKRRINQVTHSEVIEEKQYHAYKRPEGEST